MNTNDRFLNLYKRLEKMLEAKFPHKGSDSVYWLMERELKKSDLQSKRQRAEKYNIVRQVRNILSHNEIEFKSPFIVSDELIEFLEGEISLIENEKKAIDIAITFDKLLYASLDDNVRSISTNMINRGISNVPILDNKKLVGIFNGHVLLKMIYLNKSISIDEYTKMRDISDLINYKSHNGIRYEFVAKTTKLEDLTTLFKRTNNKKTELIIVTENGLYEEDVLGVISPHDVLEYDD